MSLEYVAVCETISGSSSFHLTGTHVHCCFCVCQYVSGNAACRK